MRFGIDVAQQRMPWDEVVSRVQLAEELGFDGAWGFDHFQPMYGEGPGRGVRRRHHAGGAGRADVAHPARAARHRRHLPAPVGVRVADGHRRPRVPRPARDVARRGVVRQGAHRARHPVPADRPAVRPPRGHARDLHAPHDRRHRCPTTARSCRCRTPSCCRSRCRRRTRRSGSAATARSARSRSSRATPTCGTPSARPTAWPRRRRGSTSWRSEAGRQPSDILRAGSLSLDDLDTARKHAAKWRDAGFGYLVCGWPGAGRAQVEAFAREVMPDFT